MKCGLVGVTPTFVADPAIADGLLWRRRSYFRRSSSSHDLRGKMPLPQKNIAFNLQPKHLSSYEMMKQYTSLRIPPDSSRVTHVTAAAMQPNLVSIIILTFNQLKYTKECVESIRKHTPEPHEIIFVDNGSTDVTGKWLKKLVENNSNYRLIANKKNLGFSKGCNQGIEASTGEYILLLNNDVVVTENWLAGMLECIKSAPDIGIVGPMTNNISGPQQVPAVGYSSVDGLSEYAMAFRQKNRHRRIACRRIVGFCMLFNRRLIEEDWAFR